MKLTKAFETIATLAKKPTLNRYRWYFIPTISYSRFALTIWDERTPDDRHNVVDYNVTAHFLCWTYNIYSKRKPV